MGRGQRRIVDKGGPGLHVVHWIVDRQQRGSKAMKLDPVTA